MTIYDTLSVMQGKLKAPKTQTNAFGKYLYRSMEDVLEALKPLLKEHNAAVTCNDEIVIIGDRFYVMATATLFCGGEQISTVAYAREALTKKGSDEAQITGSTSSYARKYAMNGLFAIDDTKDSDTTNKGKEESPDIAEISAKYYSECDQKTTIADLNQWWKDHNVKIKKELGSANAAKLFQHMGENKKILKDLAKGATDGTAD